MNVLVCIKRVPGTGSSVELTPDGTGVDTKYMAFTIGPHEECAVEEAIRIVAEHGGDITVLSVGPPDADEQLRYALSMGAHHAVRVDVGRDPLDPQATAAAIVAAARELGHFDLVLFGNESADASHYQVGVRVAHALDLPVVGGVKGIDIGDGSEPPAGASGSVDNASRLRRVRLHRPAAGGTEIYEAALPAAAAVMEGLNLPRYPSMRGRLRAARAEIQVIEAQVPDGGLRPIRLHKPAEDSRETVMLGSGPEAAPALVDVLESLLMSPAVPSHDQAHLASEREEVRQ
jgi:electron transfer flavoprotein beta subunit